MNSYHTQALANANIFTIMGSIYAEVARYDSAINAHQPEQAKQAIKRAQEIIEFSKSLKQINDAQQQEIRVFDSVLSERSKTSRKSELDNYLLPFAVAARMRQFS